MMSNTLVYTRSHGYQNCSALNIEGIQSALQIITFANELVRILFFLITLFIIKYQLLEFKYCFQILFSIIIFQVGSMMDLSTDPAYVDNIEGKTIVDSLM